MDNKIALVTGSTSGIGKAVAQELLRNNCTVILNSNTDENIEEILNEFQGNHVFFYKADISKKTELENLCQWIKEKFSRLDYLVANAGIMPTPCKIDTITEENLTRTIDVNLKGTFYTLQILGNFIKESSNNGAIVTLTSVDGIIGEPYGVMYSATKAGIISLTKSFARYYKTPLIRVNAVAPGLIDTPLTTSTGEDPTWTTDVSIINRIGTPEEIAHTVTFLLSDKASFMTGQVITVDGGFTLK